MSKTESFGKKLQKLREAAGLNQSELARRADFSPNYISNLERDISPSSKTGKPRPTVEAVDRLAKALNVNVNELRLAAGYAPKDAELPIELKVLDFDGLDKDDLKDISEYIQFKKMQKQKKQ